MVAGRSTRSLERMTRTASIATGAGLILVGWLLAWLPVVHLLEVDRCLDAGGSYNYVASVCDMKASHPSQPPTAIQITLSVGSGLAAIGGFLFLVRGLWLR